MKDSDTVSEKKKLTLFHILVKCLILIGQKTEPFIISMIKIYTQTLQVTQQKNLPMILYTVLFSDILRLFKSFLDSVTNFVFFFGSLISKEREKKRRSDEGTTIYSCYNVRENRENR